MKGAQFNIFGSAEGLDGKSALLLLSYLLKPIRLLGGHALEFARKATRRESIGKYVLGGADTEQALQEKLDRFRDKLKSKEMLKPSLTVKEREVLELTVKGYSIPEISEKIFLGRRTVEYYRSNLLLKFDVRNMAELIRKTIETGILD